MQQHYYSGQQVFVVHRGPDAKPVALAVAAALAEHGISAFVDERSLQPGAHAPNTMRDALNQCKVAVVLFSPDFFGSPWCIRELETVVECSAQGRLRYLPVFLFSTVEEVRAAAAQAKDDAFADQVTARTGMRHMGEPHEPDLQQTISRVAIAAAWLATPRTLLEQLRRDANNAARQPSYAGSAGSQHVYILLDEDTHIFATRIKDALGQQGISAILCSASAPGAALAGDAARLLTAQVVVAVFCTCFFDNVGAAMQLRLALEEQLSYLRVNYRVTEDTLRQHAMEAAGIEFAGQVTAGSPIQHYGVVIDGVFKTPATTVREVCCTVMQLVEHESQQQLPQSGLPLQQLQLHAQPQPQQQQQQQLLLPQPLQLQLLLQPPQQWQPQWAQQGQQLWQQQWPGFQALIAAAAAAGAPAGVHFSRPALAPVGPLQFGQQSLMLQGVMGGGGFATCYGSIQTLAELPAGTDCGPLHLFEWLQAWAAAVAAAGGPGAADTCVFTASAGGGLVAWCQQGWGVWLPPGAADAPCLRRPATPVLAAAAAGARPAAATRWLDLSSSTPLQPRQQLLVKQGLQLHMLQPQPAAAAEPAAAASSSWRVALPAELLCEEELLLLSLASGTHYSSQVQLLLVLRADEAVVAELNSMVAAAPDLPVLPWLYHAVVQPLVPCRSEAPAAAEQHQLQQIAESRAAAAYCLLVLAVQQQAEQSAVWLLDRLAVLHNATPRGSASTEAALVAQQRLAGSGRSTGCPAPLALLAGTRGSEHMQQVFAEWSERHGLPLDSTQPSGGSDDLLTAALQDVQSAVATATPAEAAAREWAREMAGVPRMLRAGSLHEAVVLLGSQGDLAAAVMAGDAERSLASLLAASSFAQSELDDAVALAQLLGNSRRAAVQLLLQHGALAEHGNCAAVAAWWMGRLGSPQAAKQQLETQQPTVCGALIEALGSSADAAVQQHAAWALANTAAGDTAGKAALLAAGAVPTLVQVLGSSADAAVQQHAAWALANMAAGDTAGKAGLLAAGAVPTLVQVLGSSADAAVQLPTARALANMAAGDAACEAALLAAGAVPALVQVLGSSADAALQRHAAQALANMAGGGAACKAALLACDAVPVLVQVLGSSADAAVQQEAAWALASMAAGDAASKAALACDAVSALVQVLSSSADAALQRHAAQAPANMAAGDAACRTTLLAAGAVPTLVQVLDCADAAVQLPTARALANMAGGGAACEAALLAAGAVPTLVQVLSSSADAAVQQEAAWALAAMAAGDAACETALLAAGAVPVLVQLLKCSADATVQLSAAGALDNLAAGSAACMAALLAAGAVSALVQVLGSSADAAVQQQTARALANMAGGGAACKAALLAAGAVPTVVQMLGSSADAAVQQEAAWALAAMAAGDAASKAVLLAAGAVPLLVQVLGSSADATVQLPAAGALANMAAGGAACKAALLTAGAVPALVRVLDSSADAVQQQASRALANMAGGDAACKAALLEAGAVPALVQVLSSSADAAVQQEAHWALMELGPELTGGWSGGAPRRAVSAAVLASLRTWAAPGGAVQVEQECCICHGKFMAGERLTTLFCAHTFHSDCVTPWLHRSVECPVCRADVEAQGQAVLKARQQPIKQLARFASLDL